MRVEVRNVKTFRGMDGLGFNASLYIDGSKVAFVMDEGCGGSMRFEWEPNANKEGFYAFCSKLAPNASEPEDTIVNCLLDQKANLDRLRRKCKNSICFTLSGDKDGGFRTLNIAPSPVSIGALIAKHPDRGLKIINILPEEQRAEALGCSLAQLVADFEADLENLG